MDQSNKPHRTPRETKKSKKHSGGEMFCLLHSKISVANRLTIAKKGPNPKAFAFANPGKLAKQAKRSHDVLLFYTVFYKLEILTM